MPPQLQTAEAHVQTAAFQLLSNYRQHDFEFVSSLELVFSELPTLSEGQIMLIQNGVGIDGKHTALLADYLSRQFGISFTTKTTPWEHCKAQLQSTKPPEGHWMPVAPWFMQWYPTLDIVEPTIRGFVRSLHVCEVSNDGTLLYRGESMEYPSVRSTLSRYWDTTDPTALKAIRERGEQDIRSRGFTKNDEDIQGALQHLGGKTNSIDFSGTAWVALYFACESNLNEDGVIWGYDRTSSVEGITVRRLDPKDDAAKKRAQYQAGWVLEPDNGLVPPEILRRVATVPKELKTALLEFLRQAGIEESKLFPDIQKVIQDGQQNIPLEALVSMFAEHLRKGDVSWVLQNTNQLLSSDNADLARRRSCLYFRGLALAISGNLPLARRDLFDSRDLFRDSEEMPKALRKNLLVIQSVLKSGDLSRIKRNLDYDASDKGWSSVSFPGYTFLGQF